MLRQGRCEILFNQYICFPRTLYVQNISLHAVIHKIQYDNDNMYMNAIIAITYVVMVHI